MVTDYLDGTLPDPAAKRFEEHIAGCLGCQTYLNQIRRTIGVLSRLPRDGLGDEGRETLLAALRSRANTGSAHG